jgi:hypothetical protein
MAAASGASVVPRLGPVIETRYLAARRSSGTVIEKLPSLDVRFAPNLVQPAVPAQAKQSAKDGVEDSGAGIRGGVAGHGTVLECRASGE